jgi:nucleoside-diphosphate-sugar epimerase
MTKILVTGASGFIGANLTRELIKSKNDVHVFVRGNSNLWRIQDIFDEFTSHNVDLTNVTHLKQNIREIQPEIVYHCSTYGVSHSQNDLDLMVQTNIQGSINLFETMKNNSNLKHLINVGSSLEYGIKSNIIKEDDFENPQTSYGITKLSQTKLSQYFAKKYNLPITALRIFTGYGPFEEPNHLIGDIMMALITNNNIKIKSFSSKRDFIFINDVVNAIITTGNNMATGEIINIGTGKEHSVNEIIEMCKKFGELNTEHQNQSNDERTIASGFANVEKSKKLLGWTPKFTLSEGLKQTFDWFVENKKYYLLN